MANKNQTNSTNGHRGEVTFARDLGLFDASMIGIGAMIGAGIFVLTGIAAGEAGPASLLAFALNGIVTLITAFAYAELASAIPRAGGGYSFVRMAFPGATGFLAGWLLWFAYTVACSLYALGFAGYFWEFFHKYMSGFVGAVFSVVGPHGAVLAVTLIVGLIFVWLNVRGAEVTGKTENALTLSKIMVLGIFLFFGLVAVFREPQRAADSLTPFFPMGFGGVLVAMGLTFIAFEGYDLIATVAEEIKNPEKNIPKATFISLGVTITIYLFILFVSLAAIDPKGQPSWQFLGEFKETAIVRAAENFMPAIGVAVIVFGGILSTMSALNATVMAASRVAFSMGRDLWLPRILATIDVRRRTPAVAIMVTGVILLGMALTLPLEAVGSAASLIFLLTFAMVNLSVIVLRRKYPEVPRKYRVPLYPLLPVLGFVLNIILAVYQFKFQPIAWFVTLGWIALGLFLYYAVFEKQASAFEPQVLLPRAASSGDERGPSVVIALHNPDNVEVLLKLALPVVKQRAARAVAISVVEVPRQTPIHEGLRFAHHKEALLEEARKVAAGLDLRIDTDLVIAHHTADGILAALQHHKARMLVMGWKGFTNARERVFGEIADRVIRHAPCDLMMLKIGKSREFESCLLPTAGGPNAKLAASILAEIAREHELSVTAAYVVPEGASAETRELAERYIDETFVRAGTEKPPEYETRLIESRSVAGGIARAGKDFDLVVIGAAKEPFFRSVLFGEVPEKVARYSPTSVLVVKRYEGAVKSLLKRIFG
jgi:amino acid transporter/nucleotide-binding universal stress UspA family protein